LRDDHDVLDIRRAPPMRTLALRCSAFSGPVAEETRTPRSRSATPATHRDRDERRVTASLIQ
jgi:hypothetical protein